MAPCCDMDFKKCTDQSSRFRSVARSDRLRMHSPFDSPILSPEMVKVVPVRVVAAVIIRDGRVLACRRNHDRAAGGQWEFPGGKIEPGESPEDALVREIREELGVAVEVRQLIHRATTQTETAHVDLSSFEARLTNSAPTSSTDHDKLRWLRPSRLHEVYWATPDLPVVELLTGADPVWRSTS